MDNEQDKRISQISQISGIAERLRLARKNKGLKQTELSLKSGLSRRTCINIEADQLQGDIGLHSLERLARR